MDPRTYTSAHVAAQAARRPAGYLDEIAPAKLAEDENCVTYDRAHPAWIAAKEKYKDHRQAAPPPPTPRPLSDWPWPARILAKARQPQDAGLGDVVARVASRVGAATLARWYERLVGAPCGCSDRQAKLNQLFPLPPSHP